MTQPRLVAGSLRARDAWSRGPSSASPTEARLDSGQVGGKTVPLPPLLRFRGFRHIYLALRAPAGRVRIYAPRAWDARGRAPEAARRPCWALPRNGLRRGGWVMRGWLVMRAAASSPSRSWWARLVRRLMRRLVRRSRAGDLVDHGRRRRRRRPDLCHGRFAATGGSGPDRPDVARRRRRGCRRVAVALAGARPGVTGSDGARRMRSGSRNGAGGCGVARATGWPCRRDRPRVQLRLCRRL